MERPQEFSPSTMTALIVGGGIGGLATALAFQRHGIKTLVFERTQQFREVGSGLILAGNAVNALHKIGLADVLHAIAAPLRSSHLRSWRGNVLVDLPMQETMQRFGTSMVAVHRAELQAALVQALGKGSLRTNMQGIGFEQDEQGVRVRFASGEEVQGDLLIGADGLHSVIRSQLVGYASPRYAGYTAWRGVTGFPLDQREAQTTFETWGAGKRFGLIPLSQGRVCWFAVANVPEGEREEETMEKQRVLHLVSSCHEPAWAVVEATDASAILRTDIYDRPPLSSWSQGRVTLVGDAAHPMTPNLGQGACQAIEDAFLLAESLKSSSSIVPALQCYEARRITRANAMVQRSWQQGRIAQWKHPWGVRVRNTVLRKTPSRFFVKQLKWILDNQIG
ncbi:FAD-dependent monooxygenase [Ktedonospora formicarum]|uniref:Monooxygenase n=1 Tax=Ktedonospora formicarum TaxID=2778364 RepID=A0A8J3I2U7_9CHLR|nr:FAD-dependent monooxygenase [Ktedonospora formicarum]GHO49082.1 monooxygenase [Ktedonospora formicarum]